VIAALGFFAVLLLEGAARVADPQEPFGGQLRRQFGPFLEAVAGNDEDAARHRHRGSVRRAVRAAMRTVLCGRRRAAAGAGDSWA